MSQVDRLYNVSVASPSQANSLIVFPNGIVPYGFSTNEDYGWDIMSGYSSGVLIEELGGAFGTMVYGTGGHTRIQNQILSLNLSEDTPNFGWFQQPYFETSAVNGAELYYNRTEFSALPANQKTGDGGGTEGTLTAAWRAAGSKFPMGYEGWIFPQKIIYGQLGNNHPHGFRYMAPCYIPATLTQWSSGAYLVIEAPQGPFAQSWLPEGATTEDLVHSSARWPSGRRKWPIWAKNVQTGIWSRLPGGFQPDYQGYGFIRQHSAVARDQRRVYVSVDEASATAAFWYIDFSAGFSGATVSGLLRPSTSVAPLRGTTGVFTDGHPDGRHLWYWPDLLSPTGLIMQDLDQVRQVQLAIGNGLSIGSGEEPGMFYDATGNRLVIVQRKSDGTIRYRVIQIPADPYQVSGYQVSAEKTLELDPSVVVSGYTHFYSKMKYHSQLGVVLVPQDRGRMLAFRPSL